MPADCPTRQGGVPRDVLVRRAGEQRAVHLVAARALADGTGPRHPRARLSHRRGSYHALAFPMPCFRQDTALLKDFFWYRANVGRDTRCPDAYLRPTVDPSPESPGGWFHVHAQAEQLVDARGRLPVAVLIAHRVERKPPPAAQGA